MKTADIAVQIVNYKTKQFLRPLLNSLLIDLHNSGLVVEINILDNASGDDLNDIASEYADHHVHIYYSPTNGGFGAGHNMLASKTKARTLLILNPDILLIQKNTVVRLLKTMDSTKAAVVGPRLLTPKQRTKVATDRLHASELTQQKWDYGKFTMWRYRVSNVVCEAAWVSGAVFLVRRQPFEAIGGFDENFFLYYEEVDFCYRLHKISERTVYDANVQVLHYGSVVARRASKHMVKSFSYFQLKRIKNLRQTKLGKQKNLKI